MGTKEAGIGLTLQRPAGTSDNGCHLNNSPGVLQAKCLDIVSEAIAKGAALPAGFSCLGASCVGIVAGAK